MGIVRLPRQGLMENKGAQGDGRPGRSAVCRGGILCRVLYKGAGHPALPAENRLPDHIPEAVSIWASWPSAYGKGGLRPVEIEPFKRMRSVRADKDLHVEGERQRRIG